MKNLIKKPITIIALSLLIVIIIFIVFAVKLSSIPSANDDMKYTIRGIDVSSYQGQIDWPLLSSQNMAFAFIKATEGSSHVDKTFKYNWENAQKTHLKIGAYHFMSFETSGEDQSKNFIETLPKTSGMLPPVIDVELYGSFIKENPTEEHLKSILTPLLEKVEKAYGQKPIIYTTSHLYSKYIEGNYDNDIWIADPGISPTLPDGKEWVFCQYSFEGVLKGYNGPVKHIDLNVFYGSKLNFLFY